MLEIDKYWQVQNMAGYDKKTEKKCCGKSQGSKYEILSYFIGLARMLQF